MFAFNDLYPKLGDFDIWITIMLKIYWYAFRIEFDIIWIHNYAKNVKAMVFCYLILSFDRGNVFINNQELWIVQITWHFHNWMGKKILKRWGEKKWKRVNLINKIWV